MLSFVVILVRGLSFLGREAHVSCVYLYPLSADKDTFILQYKHPIAEPKALQNKENANCLKHHTASTICSWHSNTLIYPGHYNASRHLLTRSYLTECLRVNRNPLLYILLTLAKRTFLNALILIFIM